jgi:hypothetical protein
MFKSWTTARRRLDKPELILCVTCGIGFIKGIFTYQRRSGVTLAVAVSVAGCHNKRLGLIGECSPQTLGCHKKNARNIRNTGRAGDAENAENAGDARNAGNARNTENAGKNLTLSTLLDALDPKTCLTLWMRWMPEIRWMSQEEGQDW